MKMKQMLSLPSAKVARIAFLAACCLALLAACGDNMRNDSRIKPYESSAAFADNQSARPIDPNTVPRGEPGDLALLSGKAGGQVIGEFPITVSRETLVQGQKVYGIYCAPCHGANADGRGVTSGYWTAAQLTPPANLLDPAQTQQPVGHYFDVITNGFGSMYSYGSRIAVEDRWAVIAYIRALQANQEAPLDVPPEQIQQAGATAGGSAR
jgi:mono/diheme cytochrome c family protein